MARSAVWPALWRVFAYAAPGLPMLHISSGSDVISGLGVGDGEGSRWALGLRLRFEGVDVGVEVSESAF